MIQKSNLITIEAVFSIAILAPNFMATEMLALYCQLQYCHKIWLTFQNGRKRVQNCKRIPFTTQKTVKSVLNNGICPGRYSTNGTWKVENGVKVETKSIFSCIKVLRFKVSRNRLVYCLLYVNSGSPDPDRDQQKHPPCWITFHGYKQFTVEKDI